LLASLVALLLLAGATACGSSRTSTIAPPSQPALHSDRDHDNTGGYYDSDDDEIVSYGQAAGAADTRQVTDLVKRYYTAAVADDGAAGCSLSYSLFAEASVENANEARHGSHPEPCPVVMSEWFKQNHAQMADELKRLHVIGVRVSGVRGYALMGEEGARTRRYLFVHREGGVWKVEAFKATELG
jgi:hypothetical protein